MKNILYVLFFLALWACNKDGKSSENTQDGMTALIDKVTESNGGGEGCFVPYQPKVCELIDVQTIARILGVQASDIEEEGDASLMLHKLGKNKDKPYKGSKYNSCEYKWTDPSGKTFNKKMPMIGDMEMRIGGFVTVGCIAAVKDIEQFKFYHRPVTQAELDEANKSANKEMDKRASEGKNTKSEAEIGKSIIPSLSEGMDIQYVEGVGEIATRTYSTMSMDGVDLTVYQNKNHFSVNVTMDTKSKEENLAMAKKIAIEILKKCK
jgi:hypothetical protein